MSTVPTPADLDLRTRRLENETRSIYDILERIDGRLDGQAGELAQIRTTNEARFNGIDGRLDAQGAQLAQILELLRAPGSS